MQPGVAPADALSSTVKASLNSVMWRMPMEDDHLSWLFDNTLGCQPQTV